jgi:hypothetical protein
MAKAMEMVTALAEQVWDAIADFGNGVPDDIGPEAWDYAAEALHTGETAEQLQAKVSAERLPAWSDLSLAERAEWNECVMETLAPTLMLVNHIYRQHRSNRN